MIRVVIAEDHQLVRQGIVALLDRAPDIEVVGEAEDGYRAVELVSEMKPDVLVMDVSMPGRNGLETLEHLKTLEVKVAVVILTMHAEAAVKQRALDAGASGYVVKGSIADDLIRAIQIANQGGIFVAPGADATKSEDRRRGGESLDQLSPREREVLGLIGEGLTNGAVGSALGISVKTVERHRTSIMKKLDARNVVELIRTAVRLGYIRIDE